MAEFDINKVKGNDRFIAGGAVLLFVLSFFHWVTVSSDSVTIAGHKVGGGSAGTSLWHAYGWNKIALILALVAGGIVIARLMGVLDSIQLPAGINLITLAVSGAASLIFLLRFLFSFKSYGGFGVGIHSHPALFWYIGLAVSFAMTYFAFLNFKSSGEVLPSKPGATPPQPPPPPAQPPGYPPTGP